MQSEAHGASAGIDMLHKSITDSNLASVLAILSTHQDDAKVQTLGIQRIGKLAKETTQLRPQCLAVAEMIRHAICQFPDDLHLQRTSVAVLKILIYDVVVARLVAEDALPALVSSMLTHPNDERLHRLAREALARLVEVGEKAVIQAIVQITLNSCCAQAVDVTCETLRRFVEGEVCQNLEASLLNIVANQPTDFKTQRSASRLLRKLVHLGIINKSAAMRQVPVLLSLYYERMGEAQHVMLEAGALEEKLASAELHAASCQQALHTELHEANQLEHQVSDLRHTIAAFHSMKHSAEKQRQQLFSLCRKMLAWNDKAQEDTASKELFASDESTEFIASAGNRIGVLIEEVGRSEMEASSKHKSFLSAHDELRELHREVCEFEAQMKSSEHDAHREPELDRKLQGLRSGLEELESIASSKMPDTPADLSVCPFSELCTDVNAVEKNISLAEAHVFSVMHEDSAELRELHIQLSRAEDHEGHPTSNGKSHHLQAQGADAADSMHDVNDWFHSGDAGGPSDELRRPSQTATTLYYDLAACNMDNVSEQREIIDDLREQVRMLEQELRTESSERENRTESRMACDDGDVSETHVSIHALNEIQARYCECNDELHALTAELKQKSAQEQVHFDESIELAEELLQCEERLSEDGVSRKSTEALCARYAELEANHASLTLVQHHAVNESDEQRCMLDGLQAELAEMRASLTAAEKREEGIGAMERQVASWKEEVVASSNRERNFEAQLEDAHRQEEMLQQQCVKAEDAQQRLSNLELKCLNAEDTFAAEHAQCVALAGMLESVREESDGFQSRANAEQRQVGDLTGMLDNLELRMKDLEERSATAEAQYQEPALASLHSEAADALARSSCERVDHTENIHVSDRELICSLREEIEQTQAREKMFEIKEMVSEKAWRSSTAAFNTLAHHSETSLAQADCLEEHLVAARSELARSASELQDKQDAIDKLRARVAKLDADLASQNVDDL